MDRKLKLVALAAVLMLTACAGVFVTAEMGAEGKIWAGPVKVNGIQVAPKFDVVEGTATVIAQSSPPYLTIDLFPSVTVRHSLGKLTDEQYEAVRDGRVLIRQNGEKLPVSAFHPLVR